MGVHRHHRYLMADDEEESPHRQQLFVGAHPRSGLRLSRSYFFQVSPCFLVRFVMGKLSYTRFSGPCLSRSIFFLHQSLAALGVRRGMGVGSLSNLQYRMTIQDIPLLEICLHYIE